MFTLPDLPYEYGALEPVISEEIMRLHHTKHHQAYVDKLNAAVAQAPELTGHDIIELMKTLDQAPESVRTAIRNQGGGHYNHSLFWTIMTPDGREGPTGVLKEDIVAKYGSFDEFVAQFNQKALALFGSGWVWLTPDLEILAQPNQDNPLMQGGEEPLMGLDVWEHAYYLDYKNKRDDYIQNWWKIVNWPVVEKRYGK